MVWKLKKSKTADRDSVADDAVIIGSSEAVAGSDGDVDETRADAVEPDFLTSRMSAVDDAVAALSGAKMAGAAANGGGAKGQPPVAGLSDDEEWSLDAFAPYKPADKLDDLAEAPEIDLISPGVTAQSGFVPLGDDNQFDDVVFDEGPAPDEGSATLELPAGFAEFTPEHTNGLGTIDFDAPGENNPLDASSSAILDDAEWELGESASPLLPPAPSSPEPLAGTVVEAAAPILEPEPLVEDAAPVVPTQPAPASPADSALAAPPVVAEPALDDNRTLAPAEMPVASAPVATVPKMPDSQPTATSIGPALIVKLGPFVANYPLTGPDMVIGRPDPNTGAVPEIAIEWDDAISRRHAQVIQQGDHFYVQDLGSKNGTFLNGQRLPENTPAQLSPTDTIRVGEKTEITLHI